VWSHRAAAELRQNAAQGPDVDLVAVRQAQDDLGGAVGARLDVGAEVVRGEAAAAQVNHLNLAPRVALHQNVLRLQVAVQQAQAVQEAERLQDLDRDALHTAPGQQEVREETEGRKTEGETLERWVTANRSPEHLQRVFSLIPADASSVGQHVSAPNRPHSICIYPGFVDVLRRLKVGRHALRRPGQDRRRQRKILDVDGQQLTKLRFRKTDTGTQHKIKSDSLSFKTVEAQ
jgi:hypothetical protein